MSDPLIATLTSLDQPTADGWRTTDEILSMQGLDPESAAARKRLLTQLRRKLDEGVIEQTMVKRPKKIGGHLTIKPAFRVKP